MTPPFPTITAITAAVCVRFGVTGLDMLSARRAAIARPRQQYGCAAIPRHTPCRRSARRSATVTHHLSSAVRPSGWLQSDPDMALAAGPADLLQSILQPRTALRLVA
jgi:hypothetical protein